jgi:hypothetical protein
MFPLWFLFLFSIENRRSERASTFGEGGGRNIDNGSDDIRIFANCGFAAARMTSCLDRCAGYRGLSNHVTMQLAAFAE